MDISESTTAGLIFSGYGMHGPETSTSPVYFNSASRVFKQNAWGSRGVIVDYFTFPPHLNTVDHVGSINDFNNVVRILENRLPQYKKTPINPVNKWFSPISPRDWCWGSELLNRSFQPDGISRLESSGISKKSTNIYGRTSVTLPSDSDHYVTHTMGYTRNINVDTTANWNTAPLLANIVNTTPSTYIDVVDIDIVATGSDSGGQDNLSAFNIHGSSKLYIFNFYTGLDIRHNESGDDKNFALINIMGSNNLVIVNFVETAPRLNGLYKVSYNVSSGTGGSAAYIAMSPSVESNNSLVVINRKYFETNCAYRYMMGYKNEKVDLPAASADSHDNAKLYKAVGRY